jgi:hypothetical protein
MRPRFVIPEFFNQRFFSTSLSPSGKLCQFNALQIPLHFSIMIMLLLQLISRTSGASFLSVCCSVNTFRVSYNLFIKLSLLHYPSSTSGRAFSTKKTCLL